MVADAAGAFLSGGVDSSAVVAFMAEASRAPSRPLESALPKRIMTRRATRPRSPSASPRTRSRIVRGRRLLADRHARRRVRDRSPMPPRSAPIASPTGGREGQGRAQRRRSRRNLRRIPPPRLLRRRGTRPRAAAAPIRRGLARGSVYPSSTGTAFSSAPDHSPGDRSGRRRCLCDAVTATSWSIRSSIYAPSSCAFSAVTVLDSLHRGDARRSRRRRARPRAIADLKLWLPGDILTKVDRTRWRSASRRASLARPPPGGVRRALPLAARVRGGSAR